MCEMVLLLAFCIGNTTRRPGVSLAWPPFRVRTSHQILPVLPLTCTPEKTIAPAHPPPPPSSPPPE